MPAEYYTAEYYKALLEDRELPYCLGEVMNEYWESSSASQGDIASGSPPYLAAPAMKLVAKNCWGKIVSTRK
jgi:hypothetical protein